LLKRSPFETYHHVLTLFPRRSLLCADRPHHRGNETGVAGVEWATKAIQNCTGDVIDFAQAAEPGSETE
jgi:hypothetical protein